jgi:hypothetical protein
MSCDILPTDVPGPHYQGDVLDILEQHWDLMVAHPPCTFLSSSGMHWTTRGLRDPKLTEDALDFVRTLLEAPIAKIALENPVGCISTRIRPADQYVHPHQFGDDASKKTGLWLKDLPKLTPTNQVPPRIIQGKERWANQCDSGQNKLGPSDDRWKERSKTYEGLANAIAQQWGGIQVGGTSVLPAIVFALFASTKCASAKTRSAQSATNTILRIALAPAQLKTVTNTKSSTVN